MKSSFRKNLLSAILIVGAVVPALALADATTDSTDKATSCQQMMDKLKPTLDVTTDPSRKGLVQKEYDQAKMALDKGKMTLCKRHMRKAMDLMGAPPNTAG